MGLYFRLYHIEFGLPHSFHADEPEIAELAIKYTYEIKTIIRSNDYYKLIPISYVYGTLPAYFFTLAVMGFSKILTITKTSFDKTTLYIFMRQLNALLSLSIIPLGSLLYYKLFKDKKGTLIAAFLLALNWTLIVQGHYINADIILTTLLTLAYLGTYLYYKHELDNKHVIFLGAVLGLAAGTKVTALLTLPLFLYIFLNKKDYRGLFGFLFTAFIAFEVTNPFAIIFANNFAFRILTMKQKEAGMVFDSVDPNPFKYILALSFMTTPLVLLTALYGKIKAVKNTKELPMHVFLIGHVFIYVLFYSLNTRRVDRWLLPTIPIILIYTAYGLSQLKTKLLIPLGLLLLGIYLYYPLLLTKQFQRYTPKAEAYLWMRDNVAKEANKLAITEEGLDPLNKLEGILVKRLNVYTSEAAQFDLPPSPNGYDYVILSSKPMQNFKNPEVAKAYPFYTEKWAEFEQTVLDETKFVLVKEFVLPKPNLVNLSDVFIYKSVSLK